MLRITNLKLNLDDAIDYASEISNLRKLVVSKCKIQNKNILLLRIFKKAVDARRKNNVHFVYSVDVELDNERKLLCKNIQHVSVSPDLKYREVTKGDIDIFNPPVIVGFGPSGIFAALLLARQGYNPIVLERGLDIAKRTKEWNDFLNNRTFKEEASILFGEGGAGTFSDGKLTTLVKDLRCRFVLKELVKAGAHPEIMYMNKPHIGTDQLKKIMKKIREEIIHNGGIVRFDSKVTDFEIENNKIKAVIVNQTERVPTEICLLGIGHSARDTFQLLIDRKVDISAKPFSVGVRIEHLQDSINKSQYGKFHNHPALRPAEYKLNFHSSNRRSAYTFCMCPGGYVVNGVTEPGTVVTNGMSYAKRDGVNANSALLVNVTPADFKSKHPLAGCEFQKGIEKLAFMRAGSNYNTPIQLVGDFLNDRPSTHIGHIKPTIEPGYEFCELKELFPPFVTETLKEAIRYFDSKINGFAHKDAVLTAPETRSSSPIRIHRDVDFLSNIQGLYPMGEGAGYAGGIMTSAVDGMKAAEQIIKKYVF